MPCWTKTETKLLDLATLQSAADALGITVEKVTNNRYVLRKGNDYITIEREYTYSPFFTKALSGSNSWDTEIMQPLTVEYTTQKVIAVYEAEGYTFQKEPDGKLIFTRYS